eukprot:821081-Prymnesium_polylepis.2
MGMPNVGMPNVDMLPKMASSALLLSPRAGRTAMASGRRTSSALSTRAASVRKMPILGARPCPY